MWPGGVAVYGPEGLFAGAVVAVHDRRETCGPLKVDRQPCASPLSVLHVIFDPSNPLSGILRALSR